jgi:hypothetical protein
MISIGLLLIIPFLALFFIWFVKNSPSKIALLVIIFWSCIGLSLYIQDLNYQEGYTTAPIECFNDTIISKYDYNGYHFDTTKNSYTLDDSNIYYKLRLNKDYQICTKSFTDTMNNYIRVVSINEVNV